MNVNTNGLSKPEILKLFKSKRDSYKATAESILSEAERHGGFTDREEMDFDRITEKYKQAAHAYEQMLEGRSDSGMPLSETTGSTSTAPARGEVFSSFGEQLQAIAAASTPGNRPDERLYQVLAASGMNEGIGSEGGYLVESQFSSEIIRKIHEAGSLAARCRRIPVAANANGLTIPTIDETSRADGSRLGGVQGYWSDEAATVTATKPKIGKIEMKLAKLFALGYSTDELLQDAAALGNVMTSAFAEELRFKLDDAIINGDGTGKPLGILQAACTVTQAKESGQAAGTVQYENVLNMWTRLWGRSRGNAAWLINQDIEPQLYSMSLAVGTGGSPIFLPGGGASDKPYATLFGRPIIPCEQCATLGTVGDIVLADLSQYLLIDKPMQSASSMHVRFIYDEQTFRVVYRVNGQPTWSAALTPFKGSNSVSPFVTLATRA